METKLFLSCVWGMWVSFIYYFLASSSTVSCNRPSQQNEYYVNFENTVPNNQRPHHSNGGGDCDKNKVSKEEFIMRMNLCRKNVSLTCQIGGNSECFKDKEAFKATAIVAKHNTQCLIEANTTALKYIRFVVKAKYIKNLNEEGSRSLVGEDETVVKTQRGRCTLGYTCINNKFIKDMRINCFAFHYDSHDTPSNGTKFISKWVAPPNYNGPVELRAMVQVSYNSFFVDVSSVKIYDLYNKKQNEQHQ